MSQQYYRVGVFVDYTNFENCFTKAFGEERVEAEVWKNFNQNLIAFLKNKLLQNTNAQINITGTWIYNKNFGGNGLSNYLNFLDGLQLYIVKDLDKNEVPIEMTCQILTETHRAKMDFCILASNYGGFVPLVNRLQDNYSVKVIQLGFGPSTLQARCWAHIDLVKDLQFGNSNKA